MGRNWGSSVWDTSRKDEPVMSGGWFMSLQRKHKPNKLPGTRRCTGTNDQHDAGFQDQVLHFASPDLAVKTCCPSTSQRRSAILSPTPFTSWALQILVVGAGIPFQSLGRQQ
ncbi:Hypothetical protein NTJ_03039 [Nesidiocoris tenuis]|uniref:Uncharacterized protein n=1 Tax=Nesidiocoris tenuis TaxID=355587 RepID=A0ABN7AD75_9HEMI|nr:Hypothetical protein NTJ_03039 [Nesidiocoris tenuis]